MDLTGFLFGNVNEEGELEDDSVLDKESVAQLSRLGVGSVLGEIVRGGRGEGEEEEDSSDDYDSEEEVPLFQKSPTAEDFTDITEIAEEEEAPPTSSGGEGREGDGDIGERERLYQKGISLAQSQLAASSSRLLSAAERDDSDDYDMETESQGYGSQVSLEPSSAPSESHSQYQTPETLLASPEGSIDQPNSESLGGLVVTPTGTQDSGIGSEPTSQSPTMQFTPPEVVSNTIGAYAGICSQSLESTPFPPPTTATVSLASPFTPETSTVVAAVTEGGTFSDSIPQSQSHPIEIPPPVQPAATPPVSIPDAPPPPPEQEGIANPALIPENMSIDELYEKVKKFFPGFKPNSILRFSSLLGPRRPSSLPRIWQGARKPKKRKKQEGESSTPWTLDLGPVPPPEMCMSDDEDKFLAPAASSLRQQQGFQVHSKGAANIDPETSEWRFGPAKLWYDMIGVPKDGRGLDYGFKLKQPSADSSEDEGKPPSLDGYVPPDDAFLMVTQQNWENKILWEVPYSPGPPITGSGGTWSTPSSSETSLSHLLSRQSSQPTSSSSPSDGPHATPGSAHSAFPIQNYNLIYTRWEDNIIWDSDAVTHIPKPSVARLDPNDPNIILGIPEEPTASSSMDKEGKKDIRKTSKYLMNKMNRTDPANSSFLGKKDMFNLSNDEYYNPKHATSTQGLSGFDSNVVQHSLPACDLYPPWFPTHLNTSSLQNFHRPKLKIRCPKGEETTGYFSISSLNRQIARKEKERERERVSSGGGEVFFMRTPEVLSACDGHLLLAEYSEQHPPVVMATGMATKIKNYYRRPERQLKSHAPELENGETTYVQNTSYFLGQLKPGQTVQSFENNLFRAPIYHHSLPRTDFLVIISGEIYIRDPQTIFVVGQQCPKVEVPAPNSKVAMQFQKEFLQVFLYRLFRESDESPRRIKMDVVRRAFPPSVISESVIRKVLKTCADFKREGYENGWWVLRSDFRLPSEEEIRSMITPEQVCTYTSMLSAEQRLKDAGYRGKSLFTVEEEEEDSSQKVDDEIRAAPWNTTHHFINAMKGKYQLSVSGPADPTGCGEGFSYTRMNTKRDGSSSLLAGRRCKTTVMGTDGDLRKLKLSKAKSVLRNFGVPEEEISKLSRWRVIDMVRTLSTEAAKSGGGVDLKSLKFARGARFSQMEAQERYREECQRVFDLQNKVLLSVEPLSSDEESSSSGGESDDELGRNLETLIRGKKTSAQLSHDQEEAERQELRRLLSEEKPSSGRVSDLAAGGDASGRATPSGDGDDSSSVKSFSSVAGRRLVISRTFCDEEGREYVRHEVVKNQAVIDAYIRLMSSGSKDVRSQFADHDEQTREDMKKEKRRIQDQLRRLRKIEEKAKKKSQKPQKPKPATTLNMRCSACGLYGHMKTNKKCPKYKNNPVNVAPTEEEIAQQEASFSQDDLVKVEGTKLVLNKAVVEHANDVRRRSLLLRFPKDKMKKRRRQGDEELDYLEKRAKSIQRRRTSPEVPFSALLEKILQRLAALPESAAFRKPVQNKVVPDYYNVIKFPMDLQSMKDSCRAHYYLSREDFWEHINLIVNNCITYNGFSSELTKNAQKVLEVCSAEMVKNEKELEQLEQEINPALDENPQVALSYVLGKVVDTMRTVPDSWPFHHPVSAKKIPDYHKIIKRPMDLDTMKKNCHRHRYHSREQFLLDLNQIAENSFTYNGPQSHYTQTAEKMRQAGLKTLEREAELLAKLESRLGDRSASATPLPSPVAPGSVPDTSNNTDLFETSQSQASGSSDAMVLLESGVAPSPGEIDVEGWEEGGGDVDLLLQDLQHSSSSSESDSESEMEED